MFLCLTKTASRSNEQHVFITNVLLIWLMSNVMKTNMNRFYEGYHKQLVWVSRTVTVGQRKMVTAVTFNRCSTVTASFYMVSSLEEIDHDMMGSHGTKSCMNRFNWNWTYLFTTNVLLCYHVQIGGWIITSTSTVYPKKYAHGFCFAVLCCGYTLTDFPIFIRLTSLALWQSNDCPSASKATLVNMDKYFMWIHYERLHNHNKAMHNKTVCIFLGIYCKGGV